MAETSGTESAAVSVLEIQGGNYLDVILLSYACACDNVSGNLTDGADGSGGSIGRPKANIVRLNGCKGLGELLLDNACLHKFGEALGQSYGPHLAVWRL